jgi:hypothetical protein
MQDICGTFAQPMHARHAAAFGAVHAAAACNAMLMHAMRAAARCFTLPPL